MTWFAHIQSFLEKKWHAVSLGSSATALVVSFFEQHGVVLISLTCTAIAPLIFKFMASIDERKKKNEELRHQIAMNILAEDKEKLELMVLTERAKLRAIQINSELHPESHT